MYKVYPDRGAAKADLLQRGQPGNKLSSLVDSSEQEDGDKWQKPHQPERKLPGQHGDAHDQHHWDRFSARLGMRPLTL